MREPMHVNERVAWSAPWLCDDQGWVFRLDDPARRDLARFARSLRDLDRPLFDWTRADFDLDAALPTLRAAFAEVRDGTGVALVKGLPREELTAEQFRALIWGIGLHFGVARPQGKMTQYLSAVRDEGTDYRSATGRGYSSNAGLDFHVDGCDVVALACWNIARAGGQSMFTSSVSAHNALLAERPDLLDLLYDPFCYSRQGEQAPDEPPFLRCPIYGVADGRLIGRWNRNRVKSAQALEGTETLSARQWEALDQLDGLLRDPRWCAEMWLAPGDLQLMSNHYCLHSRTPFEDHAEPERKRLLWRLWLATPDSPRLPPAWAEPFKSAEPGMVRGGIRGWHWDETCRAWERRQAAELGMRVPAA
jgi:hypothetical protein